MYPLAGQTAGQNGLKFWKRKVGWLNGCHLEIIFFRGGGVAGAKEEMEVLNTFPVD